MSDGKPLWGAVLVTWCVLIVGPLVTYAPALIDNPWQFIQDDGRHFVAWLRALETPELFASDPMARFFGSITPSVYKWLFAPAIALGIDVVQWHMLVLIPAIMLLGLISLERLLSLFEREPVPRLSMLLGIGAIHYSLFASGLPRDFALPIMCLAIFAYLRGSSWGLFTTLFLGAAIYPSAAVTAGVGLLCFELLRTCRHGFSRRNLAVLTLAAGGGVLGLLLFLAGANDLGPTFRLAEARDIPIFQQDGRTAYFSAASTIENISCGYRAGLFRNCAPGQLWWLTYPIHLVLIAGAFYVMSRRQIGDWRVLGGLCIGGVFLFLVASVVAFEAHLPARYARWSVQFVAGICLVYLIVRGFTRLPLRPGVGERVALGFMVLVFLAVEEEKIHRFNEVVQDDAPAVSAALRETDAGALVAGVTPYIDSVPAFGGRSVLASIELAVPYKKDYYREMEERVGILRGLFEETDPGRWRDLHVASGVGVYVHAPLREPAPWSASFTSAPGGDAVSIFETFPAAVQECTLAEQNGVTLVDGPCFAETVLKP